MKTVKTAAASDPSWQWHFTY